MRAVPLIAGIALLIYGGRECSVASGAGDAPLEITADALAAMPEPPQRWVRVTNVYPMMRGAAQRQEESGRATEVYMAFVGTESPLYENALEIAADLEAGQISEEDAQQQYMDAEAAADMSMVRLALKSRYPDRYADVQITTVYTVEGMLFPAESAIPRDARDYMQGDAPGLPLSRMWVVEDGREPKGKAVTIALVAGGVILTLAGGAVLLFFRGA